MADRAAPDPVQEFYEQRPYPPPVDGLDHELVAWQDGQRRRADYHLLWPRAAFRDDEEILVAGCGTAQAARFSVRHAAASVTGIDVSAVSLAHTAKLKDRYALANLELRRLGIERVGELGRSFDRIVCTGVLHHLRDPDAGLSALRAALKPEGAIHLMVYAPYGRIGIHLLQDYCRRLGVGATDDDIRDVAALLKTLPRDHPLAHLLLEAPDFARPDALADALLNPRERSYAVPELFDYLDRAGLTFGRWYRQAQYLPQCGSPAATPHAERLAQLSAPAGYAAVELLRGTIARHSVIAYRDDRPDEHWRIAFDDESWLDSVPLRLPHTICVEERLPPGAAAVLINRGHAFPDLALPISSGEKRLYEAMDAGRTIARIAGYAAFDIDDPAQLDRVRGFFERLWWHDQVVFDASGKRSASGTAHVARPNEQLTA